jgi:drug/metabolite transporter (DMT)-like permease
MQYSSRVWVRLILIGICFYVVGNGALFWGLQTISPTTGSLLLNLIPVLVLLAGAVWLKERPTRVQIVGILVGIGGSVLFFSPGSNAGEPLGIGIVAFGLLGISSLGILGRELARDRQVETLPLTAIPMAIGGSLFLPMAFAVEGVPKVSASGWGIVLLLATINTACGYLLYNHVLKTLAVFELSVILTLAPLVTAFWAWVLFGDTLGIIPMIGILTVIVGVVLVQWGRKNAALTTV